MKFKQLSSRLQKIFNFKPSKTIATHDGTFHADEVLGCTMLSRYTKEFENAKIVRSRDPKVLNTADLVLDVGGEYNPTTCRFDHHQRGFYESFTKAHSTRLSSAGLIYRHYGREIIKRLSEQIAEEQNVNLEKNKETEDLIYFKVYDSFIHCIDAIDNGITQYPREAKSRYYDSTGISSRISRLNPLWTEKIEPELQNKRFLQAMDVMNKELKEQVREVVGNWLPSKNEVRKAFDKRTETHPSGSIIKLNTICVWKSHLMSIEQEARRANIIKFILYQERNSSVWRVHAIPLESNSFALRQPLRQEWRGLKDEELQRVSKISDATFVHSNGFIGGAKSYLGALKMAELSLK